MCSRFHQKPEAVQTVKLTLDHRSDPIAWACRYQRRYVQLFVHRMNQTAHISLQILSISNSVETKSTGCALTCLARPASVTSVFVAVGTVWLLPCCPSGVPLCASAPPVRGLLRRGAGGRNTFFQGKCIFCPSPRFFFLFSGLVQFLVADPASKRKDRALPARPLPHILWLSPAYPQSCARQRRDSPATPPVFLPESRESPARLGPIHPAPVV